MLIAALFTIAKTWKQPKCPSTDEWTKKAWYIYIMEYYSAIKKEWSVAICSNMGRPRDYYIEWSGSERESQISDDIIYVWTLKKWCRWIYLQKRNRFTDIEDIVMVTKGEIRGGVNLGLTDMHCYIKNNQQRPTV